MSLLNEYIQKEQLFKQLKEELDKMEGDERLKSELEFKEKLETLMAEFSKSANDVINLLEPKHSNVGGTGQTANSAVTGRRKRKLKIYKNPTTGEVVETRGGNQKTLKSWKDEFGNDTVESWLVRIEE